ncbi:MAG: maleylacetoacetate isomerase [Pseudomonadota bacterium]
MKLFGYWRSSATYRIRIILALKGLDYAYQPVNLLAGEQRDDAYKSANPQALVPTLVTDDGARLTQSLAIAAYLEEVHPSPSVLPTDPVARAQARAIAAAIACEAQPFMNLRVQRHLKRDHDFDDPSLAAWLERWAGGVLRVLETTAREAGGAYCVGAAPGLADAFLIPQLYASRRFGMALDAYETLLTIERQCLEHDAFQAAHPDRQPDAPPPSDGDHAP